ncbi:exodeoxyribonuclease V subunit beta [Vogesella sp. AC12]|uniref:exodeoxyribonuclease V subunit beta n=1 Tax=Vogesella sp. AC12 TaxID=2950550 RepID=UPI00210C3222|nr:exodeoxyribonuclease V subunit beta [Vogesella sp. AC12]MCQ4143560.1 exodeoxyribonuclease V subunit beta [Vogesella sp. AC12]
MHPLDPLNCPLTGTNLIEASAGTGKTWTIAALYTRLLLEHDADGNPPPTLDKLLVVTYTKAATAELRDRLRRRLAELARVMDGEAAGDAFLTALAARLAAQDGAMARERLRTAINGFDAAAIYTIHGFCQRVLTDAAFDSGQTFAAELASDNLAELQQLADDFWRQHIVALPALSQVLAENGDTPEGWLAEIRPFLSKPYLRHPDIDSAALLDARAAVAAAWQPLQAATATIEEGCACLLAAEGLSRTSYKPEQRQRYVRLLQLLAADASLPQLSSAQEKDLQRLTPAALAKGCNKGATPPEHALFGLVETWLAAWADYSGALAQQLAGLKLQLIAWINRHAVAQRRATRSRGFDDLLTDLAAALEDAEHGPRLAARIAADFSVALIDEFQDTDPLQYRIFRHAFVQQQRPVFMVGDPKQAIYSFRGADIFAYLAARNDAPAQRQYTLLTNRRSQAPLVAAVNALFDRPQPFLLDGIDYPAVDAAPAGGSVLEVDDGDAAFNLLTFPASDSAKGVSKTEATPYAADACAHEIARLLALARANQARLRRGDSVRPLAGGDIAVLVASHRQGDAVREALAARGVPSVALTQESVFASREAGELLALLRAWAEPASEGRLKALCATELSGFDAARLLALLEDETAWEAQLAANLDDHKAWQQRGFMAAWRAFFARQAVAVRLLPQPDGERRLTNLGHLAELIQQQSEHMAGIAPLLAWFEAQVASPPAAEEALLRLESDAELVKIVTIHTSKGLQYPLVFCPFLWDGALERRDTTFWRYRDGDESWLAPDDLVSAGARDAARSEILAEKLRLLYVALTRAEHRQYVVWGHVQKMHTAALSWLLHGRAAANLAQLEAGELLATQVADDVADLAARLPDAVRCREVDVALNALPPEAAPDFVPQLAGVNRSLYTPWRVSSFTGLTRHLHGGASPRSEAPDHDHGPLQQPDAAVAADRFSFPRGARAGTCLHEMFERADFTRPEAWPQVVQEALHKHGFDALWQDAALAMLHDTLHCDIAPGVRLAAVPNARRLVEMEFTLPADGLSLSRLQRILTNPAMGLAAPLREAAATLTFDRVQGYLKGFIDLAFIHGDALWLVDYKSNHLGDGFACYDDDALAASVAREHYYLQYLIYCVALRRYLAQRAPQLRLGGVRYLYLRGISGAGYGVWRDAPSEALLDALDGVFRATVPA